MKSYSTSTPCNDCPRGTYSDKKFYHICTDCGKGTYNPSTASANRQVSPPRRPSFFIANTSHSTDCTECPIGKYQERLAAVALADCTNCTKGKYQSKTGEVSRYNCLNCDAGLYAANSGAPKCDECEPGFYSPQMASMCTKCPPGQFSSVPKAANCANCPAAKFTEKPNSIKCTPCDKGKVAQTESSVTCEAKMGYTNNSESTDFFPCAAGQYSNPGTNYVCTRCDADQVSNETAGYCEQCPQYQEPANEQTTCECKPTFVLRNGACTCAAGHMLVGEACTPCPADQYKSSDGISACSVCDRNITGSITRPGVNGSLAHSSCYCGAGFFQEGSSCSRVSDGVDGSRTHQTLVSLYLEPGNWRVDSSSNDVRECQVELACAGGNSSEDNAYCR